MADFAERVYRFLKEKLLHVDMRSQIEIAEANGFVHGERCTFMGEVIIDPSHCWLIEVGNDVTFAPRVHVLAHDASTKRQLGYTRISKVMIGNNVFVGANSLILPGVHIGNDVIIGAGSVVSSSIPSNSVAVGNPCKVISAYTDYIVRKKNEMTPEIMFDESYRIGVITEEKKNEMKNKLEEGPGFVI